MNGAAPTINQNDLNGRNSVEINNRGLTGNAWKGISFISSKKEFKRGDTIVIRLPIYLSLIHICGHPSDIENLQLAHFYCNRQKSDKLFSKEKEVKEDVIGNRNLPKLLDWMNYKEK